MEPERESRVVIDVRVDAVNYESATRTILEWAPTRTGRYVCVLAVHGVMEAHDSLEFREVINGGDMNTPDGVPVMWGLRLLGARNATRVYGPDLTRHTLAAAAKAGVPVGFYGGSSDEVLREFIDAVTTRYEGLKVAYAWSPPFRPLTDEEDRRVREDVAASGAQILYVGLGCPKQERWMAAHKEMPVVQLGVGGGVRLPGGPEAAGAGAHSEAGARMVLPPSERTAQAVEALSEAQPAIRVPDSPAGADPQVVVIAERCAT